MTTADVVTTIKEYVWIVMLIFSVLTAYFGGGWGRRGIGWTFALTRARRLATLQKRQARMLALHKSVHAYVGRLLSGVLWVLVLAAMQVLFECVVEAYRINNPGWPPEVHNFVRATLNAERYCLSWAAGMIAGSRLLDYGREQRFDRAKEGFSRAIAALEARTAPQPVPVHLSVREPPAP